VIWNKEYKIVKKSGLFDEGYYLKSYEDIRKADIDPIKHFIEYGWKEGRNPSANFDTNFYLESYPDVREAGINPLVHYIRYGSKEGRVPAALKDYDLLVCNIYFDKSFYLNAYKDVKDAEIDPILHYLEHGYKEGRNPSANFDTNFYLESCPDVREAGINPLVHFLRSGRAEGRKISNENSMKMSKYVKLMMILKHAKKNPHFVRKFIKEAKTNGVRHSLNRAKAKLHSASGPLAARKYEYKQPLLTKEIIKEINDFTNKPLISIIMPVYNVDPKWLNLAIKSIENQWYKNWELCIADDKSTHKKTVEYLKNIKNPKIKVKYLEQNLNISGASNAALELASGEYIALMDNDDEITPDALYEVVKAINETGADFVYSDENKLEMDGSFSDPHFKPDFAPDMFLSQNYISHLGVIKKSLIEKVGGWEIGLEGAQDYDLYLKVLEHTDKIYHIQKVLYYWRKIPGSTAAEFSDKSYAQDAGIKALQNAMNRRKIDVKVENGKYSGTYKVRYKILNNPLVSIIIPFKDKPELLKMCIESILKKSTYKNFEIIGISNNSTEQTTFNEMQRLEKLHKGIKFYEYNVPFNYSDINNHAVKTYAKGEHILLLNNDIEIITPDWIESMLEHSQREEIGCVGAKLYYPNDKIQHAGVIIGIGGIAGHSHKYIDKMSPGYFSRLELVQNISAITAACLMVKTSIFQELEGLNEESLKIAFNDVDFCLRVQENGYRNIFTPYCEAYHHESISRGAEDNPEKVARFNTEVEYMKKRHQKILENGDPYYNQNLTLNREDFSLR